MKACNYIYDKIRYGVEPINGWIRTVLHPIDTVKNIGSSLWNPAHTAQVIYSQIKEHPTGMIVNFGLSWEQGMQLTKV